MDAAEQAILLATADATTASGNTTTEANHAPVFTTAPVTQAVDGKPYRYAASAADAEGDPIAYRIARGLVSWPQPVQGDWTVTLRASVTGSPRKASASAFSDFSTSAESSSGRNSRSASVRRRSVPM
nr:hypothetical protein [Solimonas sp. K1W22B-7]